MSGEEDQRSVSNRIEAVEWGEESAHIEELTGTSQNQVFNLMNKIEALEAEYKKLAEENQNLRDANSKLESFNKRGEESAHIEELTGTSQNQLFDLMRKIAALEVEKEKLGEENQNLRDAKSKLESLNKVLADQVKRPGKQLNQPAVPNGVSHGVVNDLAREINSSNLAKTRPPASQYNELQHKDLSNFVEGYVEIQKQLDSLKATCEQLKTTNATLLAEKVELKAKNNAECLVHINDYFDIWNEFQNLINTGMVRAIDDDSGHDNEEDCGNQEEPREMVGFSDPFNCEVRCSSCVFLFILHRMRLQLCTRRFLMYLQCMLCKKPGAKCEIGRCSYSLNDFYEAGLIEEVFNTPITDTCTINDALCKARIELKGQSHPAVLSMEYEKNKDGTQPVGHSVAIMPDGKYIDAKERRYWKPTCDSRIMAIHVFNVRKRNIRQLQLDCGLQKCSTECLIDLDEGTPSDILSS